jgi:hypothetical protein
MTMARSCSLASVVAVLLLALTTFAQVAPAKAASGTAAWRSCPGVLSLQFGDSASRLKARGLSCARARQVVKAPASKLGYRCTNPFDRPQGSGGWITCRKGTRAIRFLYGQA